MSGLLAYFDASDTHHAGVTEEMAREPGRMAELWSVRALIDRYRDQEIGVADASSVVLAERYRTDRVLTLDHRHFRVLRASDGSAFTILPA